MGHRKQYLCNEFGRIERRVFREVEDRNGNHLYTVCTLFDRNHRAVAQGLSILSSDDEFNRENGRNRAFGRAFKAMVRCQSFFPIGKGDNCFLPVGVQAAIEDGWEYKANYIGA